LLIIAGAHRLDDQKVLTVPCMQRETIWKNCKACIVFVIHPTCMYCLVNKGQTSVKSNNVFLRYKKSFEFIDISFRNYIKKCTFSFFCANIILKNFKFLKCRKKIICFNYKKLNVRNFSISYKREFLTCVMKSSGSQVSRAIPLQAGLVKQMLLCEISI
jgi:hypothetical protein